MEAKICIHPNCKNSGEPQTIDLFTKDKYRPDGHAAYCRVCRNNYARERLKNPDARRKHNEAVRKYRSTEYGKRRIKARYTSPEYRSYAREYQKEYRKRPEEKLRQAMKQARYRTRNKLKEKARGVVGYALKAGKLQKPDCCEYCKQPATNNELEAHHWRGYDPNNWLNVKFVHKKCHFLCEGKDWK